MQCSNAIIMDTPVFLWIIRIYESLMRPAVRCTMRADSALT